MSSKLANQLSKIAEKSVQKNVDEQTKFRPSILFSARKAAEFDNNVIFELGLQGLHQLIKWDGKFEQFEKNLYSEGWKTLDRTVQTKEENLKLDELIGLFLKHLTPHALDKNSAGKALEWLIRRFRVQEFNQSALLEFILPYHDTKIFVDLVKLLKIVDVRWKWLEALKDTPLDRQTLVQRCITDISIVEFICQMALNAAKLKVKGNQTLWAFVACTLVTYLQQVELNTKIVSVIVPFIVEAAGQKDALDLNLTALLLLGQVTDKNQLTWAALEAITNSIARNVQGNHDLEAALIKTLGLLSSTQESFTHIPEKAFKFIIKYHNIASLILSQGSKPLLNMFLRQVIQSMATHENYKNLATTILSDSNIPQDTIIATLDFITSNIPEPDSPLETNYAQLLQHVQNRWPKLTEQVLAKNLGKKDGLNRLLSKAFDGTKLQPVENTPLFLSLSSHDVSVRLLGLEKLQESISSEGDVEKKHELTTFASEALISRLRLDTDAKVLERVLAMDELWDSESTELMEAISHLISSGENQRVVFHGLRKHLKRKDLIGLLSQPENLGKLLEASLSNDKQLASEAWYVFSALACNSKYCKSVDGPSVEALAKNIKGDDVKTLLEIAQVSHTHVLKFVVDVLYHSLGKTNFSEQVLSYTNKLPLTTNVANLLSLALTKLGKSEVYPYSNDSYSSILSSVFVACGKVEQSEAVNQLLMNLFQHHLTEPLPFLVRFWIDASQAPSVRCQALAVASVFLSNKSKTDYQHLIAPLLIPLSDSHKQIRSQAVGVLQQLSGNPWAAHPFAQLYPEASLVNLTKQAHSRLLQSLLSRKSEILADDEIVKQILTNDVAYLASHVASCPLTSARITWLKLMEKIESSGKMTHLLPLVKSSLDTPSELSRLLIRSFDAESLSQNETCLQTYLDILSPESDVSHQITAVSIVTPVFYHLLSEEAQAHVVRGLCNVIVKSMDSQVVRLARQHLFALPVTSTIMISEFENILERLSRSDRPNTPKRARGNNATDVTSVDHDAFQALVVLLELLVAQKDVFDGDNMIPTLQDILNVLLTATSQDASVSIELLRQLTLTGLLQLLNAHLRHRSQTPTGKKSALAPLLRVDLMVQCLRVTDNPQTHHAALLLLTSIAKIVPELVLRNVMPVFTFMGSNILRHDDSYSIHVIEETLHTLVPALVANPSSGSAIPVVRVFVEAMSHIPLHRRMGVFVTLLNALGPDKYLSIVVSMLLEHSTSSKKQGDDGMREFAVALTGQFPLNVQMSSVVGLLEIIKELPLEIAPEEREKEREVNKHAIYDPLAHSDREFRQWRLLCMDYCHKTCSDPEWSQEMDVVDLVQLLMDLIDSLSLHATKSSDSSAAKYWKGTLKLTYSVLERVLDMLDSNAHLQMISGLLQHGQPSVRTKALQMLTDRSPKLPSKLKDPAQLFGVLQSMFKVTKSEADKLQAHQAMVCIATLGKQKLEIEPAIYVDTMNALLVNMKGQGQVASSAMTALASLLQALGPRSLPVVPKLVNGVLEVLEKKPEQALVSSGLNLLLVLIKTLPQFLGSFLVKILHVVMIDEHCHLEAPEEIEKVVLELAKLPVKQLLPALNTTLNAIKHSWSIELYAKVIPEMISHLAREDVAANSTQIFKQYLHAFDCRTNYMGDTDVAEQLLVSGFVKFVLKLNEKLFRPMFFKIVEWATSEDLLASGMSQEHVDNRILFLYKLLDGLLDGLKVIAVPYYMACVDKSKSILESDGDNGLKTLVLSTLTKFFTFDSERSIDAEKLSSLVEPIVSQLDEASLDFVSSSVAPCLSAMTSLGDDQVWKKILQPLLARAHSSSPQVRLACWTVMMDIWKKMGEEFLPMLPDIVPYLVEAWEDIDGNVVRLSKQVGLTIQDYLGEDLMDYLDK